MLQTKIQLPRNGITCSILYHFFAKHHIDIVTKYIRFLLYIPLDDFRRSFCAFLRLQGVLRESPKRSQTGLILLLTRTDASCKHRTDVCPIHRTGATAARLGLNAENLGSSLKKTPKVLTDGAKSAIIVEFIFIMQIPKGISISWQKCGQAAPTA